MPNAETTLKRRLRSAVPSPLWAIMRRAKVHLAHKRFNCRTATHTYHGQVLKVEIADGVAEGWYDHDWPEQAELSVLQQSKLKPGAVVYDCGAHQCVVALMLAGIVGPTGRVIAVEANAYDAEIGNRNVAQNQSGRAPVEVLHAAIAAHDGTLRFNGDPNKQAAAGKNARVPTSSVRALTLNSLSRQYPLPDVVFIDIEGAETLALAACEDLFRDGHRPAWFVEVHSEHGLEQLGGSVEQILGFFRTHSYQLHWADPTEGRFRPIGAEEPRGRFYLVAVSVWAA
jgi:FkbM family methyltransferase